MQNFDWTIAQVRNKWWANETSRDLSLRLISDRYPIMHKALAWCYCFTVQIIPPLSQEWYQFTARHVLIDSYVKRYINPNTCLKTIILAVLIVSFQVEFPMFYQVGIFTRSSLRSAKLRPTFFTSTNNHILYHSYYVITARICSYIHKNVYDLYIHPCYNQI